MFGYDLFFEKIHYIRNMYDLSYDNMAAVFQTIDISIEKPTIYRWEKKKSLPPITAVKSYSDIFGVDPAWLLNISPTPYTKDSIENAEAWFNYYQKQRWGGGLKEEFTRDGEMDCMFLLELEPNGRGIKYHEDKLMRKYGNFYYRRDNYTLEVRANIINILRIMMLFRLTRAKLQFYDDQVYRLISSKNKEAKPLYCLPDELNSLAFRYSENYKPNQKFNDDMLW